MAENKIVHAAQATGSVPIEAKGIAVQETASRENVLGVGQLERNVTAFGGQEEQRAPLQRHGVTAHGERRRIGARKVRSRARAGARARAVGVRCVWVGLIAALRDDRSPLRTLVGRRCR